MVKGEVFMGDGPEPKEEFSFLQERVKQGRWNKNRILLYIAVAAIMGLVFGLSASAAFVWMQPQIRASIDEEETIRIPEDEDAENSEEEKAEEAPAEEENASEEGTDSGSESADAEGQGNEGVPSGTGTSGSAVDEPEQEPLEIEWTIEDVDKMGQLLYDVSLNASKSLVIVHSVDENEVVQESYDFTNAEINQKQSTGIMIASTSTEILILVPMNHLHEGDLIMVEMVGNQYEATIKMQDKNTGYAILSLPKEVVGTENLVMATLGNSNSMQQGDFVIAIGNQFAYKNGLAYGVVSSVRNTINMTDGSFELISTDIPSVESGTGVLVNLEGEIIGLIQEDLLSGFSEGAVSALGISRLKDDIELMSNGKSVPYLGIKGIGVSVKESETNELEAGLYVQEIAVDSPAMQAGIKIGDKIKEVDGVEVVNQQMYRNQLLATTVGESIEIIVERQGAEGYVEVEFEVTVGSKE